MVPWLWKGLIGIGLFALAHAAFRLRSIIRTRLKEEGSESLPADIVLQTLLAFAVTCYGVVHTAGEFKDRDATSELRSKTFDALRSRPSFYVFRRRHGRGLSQPSDTARSSNISASSSDILLKF